MKTVFKKLFHKRTIISLVIVIVLASITGYFGAQFYIDKFMIEVQAVTESEDRVRDDIDKVLRENSGKSPSEISPKDNFIIAEHYLNKQTSVKKITSGTVTASGIKQGLYAEKIFDGSEYYSMKISSGLVSLATRLYYKNGAETVDYFNGTDIKDTTATFPAEPTKVLTLEEYKQMYGSPMTYFINYVVSSNTVLSEEYLGQTENGNYKFKLNLDTAFSVMNYSYELKTTAGSSKLPKFESIELTFEIDGNFNLLRVDIKESYQVAVPQLGNMYMTTSGELTEIYEYGGTYEIPRS